MKTMNVFYFATIVMMIEFSFISSQCCGGCGSSNAVANTDPSLAINGLKYFVGDWVGLEYQCFTGSAILEQINFPDESNKIYAKKITGDNCVHVGQTTFAFHSYPAQLKINVGYPVTWTIGNPMSPNSGKNNGTLKIVDNDNFTVDGKRFVRGRLNNGQLVKVQAKLPAPKPCKKTFVKEILRQTLDDKGKVVSTSRERIIETWAERSTDEWAVNDTLLTFFDNTFKTN